LSAADRLPLNPATATLHVLEVVRVEMDGWTTRAAWLRLEIHFIAAVHNLEHVRIPFQAD